MIVTGLLLGALLGYVLQRSRFCVTGAFRDLYMTRSTRYFTPFLLAIAIQAVGVVLLTGAGVIAPEAAQFAPLAVIGGGLLFGIGIVMAGGCATGTYYRAGEGLIGSWVALIFYALFAAVMKYGPLQGFTESARARTVGDATIQETLGVSAWVPTIAFSALVAVLVVRQVRANAGRTAVRLPARRSGLGHYLADIPWNPWVGGVLLGLLAIAAWVLSTAAGRNGGLGITTPSAKIATFLTTGDVTLVDWSVMLVLGILLGSFAAAKLSGEFRWRVPDAQTILRSAGGGVAMGVGAALAGGCTIGNSLVETSLFSYQGWVSFVAIMLGTWGAAWLFLVRPQKAAAASRPAPTLTPAA
ncbi:YeeE/YedE family protein [Brachybacterium saurashtrense]|uniref:YeeE/YedE family protein n=1 Tax=Brachybacterium saurashtrense TaxID=556288 RepID=A0A345YSW9_9MICO|nr:YeeE/YedE family protein [Brachybacterium saurashtrense]AXK47021.1 YeeE/YedE family protein [Brachybacterium saurashtrense]RRR20870.1 YeeE/YedE family protein [Brachybacterium saurashtrense]